MNAEEIAKLFGLLDDRYVKKDTCVRNIAEEDEKIDRVKEATDSIKVELAKLATREGIVVAILATIAVPVVALCIKLLFGG